jgi:hypothetical protein
MVGLLLMVVKEAGSFFSFKELCFQKGKNPYRSTRHTQKPSNHQTIKQSGAKRPCEIKQIPLSLQTSKGPIAQLVRASDS